MRCEEMMGQLPSSLSDDLKEPQLQGIADVVLRFRIAKKQLLAHIMNR
jgi:hypothetical protein